MTPLPAVKYFYIIEGFKSRAEKKFAAKLKIVGDEIKFEFDN